MVVLAATEEEWPAIRKFFGGTAPAVVYRDPGGRGAASFGVSTLPETYLLDADGGALLRFRGARDWRSSAARALIRSHLAPSPVSPPARLRPMSISEGVGRRTAPGLAASRAASGDRGPKRDLRW